MKPGSESKKTEGVSGPDPLKDDEGIDALTALQFGAGIICLVFVAWFILHGVLHII